MTLSTSDDSVHHYCLRSFPGRVHFRQGDTLLGSHNRTIYRSHDEGKTWHALMTLPVSAKTRLQAILPATRRLFRQDIYHLIPLDDRILVTFAFRSIFVCDLRASAVLGTPTPIFGARPHAVCLAPDGTIYYGEYRGYNKMREPVHIFSSEDQGRSWISVRRMERVRHIHGVYYDPIGSAFWVTTGDTDAESAIWVSGDRFRSLERIVAGNQQTRTIRLLFTNDHVYFGSDAPGALNHIYRLCRGTHHVEALTAVDGPIYHGCKTKSGLFFSTGCEPNRSHPGRYSMVWYSPDGESWRPLLKFKKDFLPMKLFQYGQVFFAEGQESSAGAWLTPLSTTGSGHSIYVDEEMLRGRDLVELSVRRQSS
jgi:hypothetical protein